MIFFLVGKVNMYTLINSKKRAFPQKTTFPRKPIGADDDAFTGRRARMRCQPQREE